jgi:phosphoketolase
MKKTEHPDRPLSVGQIYLYDNPLLKKPLKLSHIKPRLLGHWGITPGVKTFRKSGTGSGDQL